MVYEFAIDPRLVDSWTKRSLYRIFVREFGLGSPRAFSGYPAGKSWERLAIRSARSRGATDQELSRLAELIKLLHENRIPRTGSNYNQGENWLPQALSEHRDRRFWSILSSENPDKLSDVISGDLEEFLSHDKWYCDTRALCKRSGDDIINAAGEMLKLCRTAVFVDPYFHPGSPRYKRSIPVFLKSLCGEHARDCSKVEIITNDKESSDPARTFAEVFQNEMPTLIPEGMTVTLRRLREVTDSEKLHDRFILTELGGVTISVGLDQGERGQHTQVFLMSKEQYQHWWKVCKASDGEFTAAGDSISVVGTCPAS